jgi:hypothetical protein
LLKEQSFEALVFNSSKFLWEFAGGLKNKGQGSNELEKVKALSKAKSSVRVTP